MNMRQVTLLIAFFAAGAVFSAPDTEECIRKEKKQAELNTACLWAGMLCVSEKDLYSQVCHKGRAINFDKIFETISQSEREHLSKEEEDRFIEDRLCDVNLGSLHDFKEGYYQTPSYKQWWRAIEAMCAKW